MLRTEEELEAGGGVAVASSYGRGKAVLVMVGVEVMVWIAGVFARSSTCCIVPFTLFKARRMVVAANFSHTTNPSLLWLVRLLVGLQQAALSCKIAFFSGSVLTMMGEYMQRGVWFNWLC